MTVNTKVIRLFLSQHNQSHVPISSTLRLQVLPSIDYLPSCQKHHFAAFIQDRGMLIVWDDQPKMLIDRAEKIEQSLMRLIWNTSEDGGYDEKQSMEVVTTELDDGTVAVEDLEEALKSERRPIVLVHAFMVGVMLALLMTCLGAGWRKLAIEVEGDHTYTRLALVVVTVPVFFVSLVSPPNSKSPMHITDHSSSSCKLSLEISCRSLALSVRCTSTLNFILVKPPVGLIATLGFCRI